MLNIETIRLNASALALTLLFMVGFYLMYRDMRKMEGNFKMLDAAVDELSKSVMETHTLFNMPFDLPKEIIVPCAAPARPMKPVLTEISDVSDAPVAAEAPAPPPPSPNAADAAEDDIIELH